MIDPAPRKFHRNDLLDALLPGEIRKINRLVENCGNGRIFCLRRFDAQGKRRQREFLVFEFDLSAYGLPRENVLWKNEAHFDPGEANGRKNPGHENEGDEAGKNQEEQVISGVQRGQRHEHEAAEIDPAFARNLVFGFVADPAQRRAARQRGHQRYRDPSCNGQGRERGSTGGNKLAEFCCGARIERQEECAGERGHGEKKRADAWAVGPGEELRESGGNWGYLLGTRLSISDLPSEGCRQ